MTSAPSMIAQLSGYCSPPIFSFCLIRNWSRSSGNMSHDLAVHVRTFLVDRHLVHQLVSECVLGEGAGVKDADDGIDQLLTEVALTIDRAIGTAVLAQRLQCL